MVATLFVVFALVGVVAVFCAAFYTYGYEMGQAAERERLEKDPNDINWDPAPFVPDVKPPNSYQVRAYLEHEKRRNS